MKMWKEHIQRGAVLLLTVLFVGYYGATTLFVHTHQSEWGTVTHSHPFLPSSAQHTHTAHAFLTIAALSAILTTGGVLVALLHLFLHQPQRLCSQLPQRHFLSLIQHVRALRAPPVTFI